MTNSESDLDAYAARLYERRTEGILTKIAKASLEGWKPSENSCHENVMIWCSHESRHKPIHGWLYFNYEEILPFVTFNAHSVIENEDGDLVDITPSRASQPYPFITLEESAEDFASFFDGQDISRINYYISEGRAELIPSNAGSS